MIDIEASLETLRRNEHDRGQGPLKLIEDILRYEAIIRDTGPDLIVETGTRNGESARWFAEAGQCDVITIDVLAVELRGAPRVRTIIGDAVHPRVIERVRRLTEGRRVMVSLDSDHSTQHVAMEIALYGPLVSNGCYLVVEDGIFHYADRALRAQHGLTNMVGDPLIGIHGAGLNTSSRWSYDRAIEDMYPVTHNVGGYWRRTGR